MKIILINERPTLEQIISKERIKNPLDMMKKVGDRRKVSIPCFGWDGKQYEVIQEHKFVMTNRYSRPVRVFARTVVGNGNTFIVDESAFERRFKL